MKNILLFYLFTSLLIAQTSKKTSMTIYKDGTGLVKQKISWSNVIKGKNTINYKNIPKSIHKNTPFINFDVAQVLNQRFVDNVFNSDQYHNLSVGSLINVKPINEKIISGQLLEITKELITIQSKNRIRTYNRKNIEYLEAKDNIINPNFSPYLSWEINSKKAGDINGDLVYKLNGINWETVYRLVINGQVKGELVAEAVISNNSNKDYLDTEVQLVEGKLNKIRKNNNPSVKYMAPKKFSSDLIDRQLLGDYHIYDVGEIKNLVSNESITVRMYGPLSVDYKKIYIFENSERQQKEEPLNVELTLFNTEVHGLGIPLPAGKIDMYTFSGFGGIDYIGSDQMGQVSKGESAKIQAGYAFDIIGKRKVLNYSRQRKSEEAVIEISISNNRVDPVQILIVEHINGDWVIKDQSHDYKKENASTIHFPLNLEPGKKEYVNYTYKKEWN